MSNELAQLPAFKAMQTDLQVSMDDVVSAFVSQYESNLFARKKELTGIIRDLEKGLSDNRAEILKNVNGDEYEKEAQRLPFGLTAKVKPGEIEWEDNKVLFAIEIKNPLGSPYGSTLTLKRTQAIPAKYRKIKDKISKELDEVRADLGEVLVALKSVARKERQVRGRIAMRKLEDSGYASLMQDEELAQLVQLDD